MSDTPVNNSLGANLFGATLNQAATTYPTTPTMFGPGGYWQTGTDGLPHWTNQGFNEPGNTNKVLNVPSRNVGAATTDFYDGNLTAGRHNYYGTLYLGDTPVGGMQSWSIRETNGTQFIPNAGNDWLEPRFGMRQWQGQGNRFMIRGRDIQELMRRYYSFANKGLLNDVDFRFTPFTWLFHFNMKTFLQRTVEDLSWHIATVWITEYTWRYQSPFDLIYEDFTFIAKGLRRIDTTIDKLKGGHVGDFGNPIELWGNPQHAKDYNDLSHDAYDDNLLRGLTDNSITTFPPNQNLP